MPAAMGSLSLWGGDLQLMHALCVDSTQLCESTLQGCMHGPQREVLLTCDRVRLLVWAVTSSALTLSTGYPGTVNQVCRLVAPLGSPCTSASTLWTQRPQIPGLQGTLSCWVNTT